MLNGNATTVQLTPLRTPISNGALAADKLPTRLKLSHWGDNPSVKGNVRLSELSARVLPQRQQASGFAKIALDFEHNTVPGSPEYERSTEPRRVAAYGVPRIVAGDGLYLEDLEWTPVGRSEALNYADLSPAVELDAQGNILFIHSAALTRNGAVEGLSFFSTTIKPNEQTIMPEKFLTLAAIAAIVGLQESATEAEITTALKNRLTPAAPPDLKPLSTSIEAMDTRVKTLEAAGNKGLATLSATIDGKVITLSAEDVARFGSRLNALESALATSATAESQRERETIIARFSADGKVPLTAEGTAYTDAELKKLDAATLRLLHANTPVTVPLHARGKTLETKSGSELKGLAKAIALHQSGH